MSHAEIKGAMSQNSGSDPSLDPKPKASIIMGAYNASRTIESALNSLFAQDEQNFEIVITDDGSNDDTLKILEKYAALNPNLILARHTKNLGLATALNTSIGLAKSDYLIRQDSDDISSSNRVGTLIREFEKDHTVDVLGTYFNVMDKHMRIWGVTKYPEAPELRQWMRGTQVAHATVIMKKSSVLAVGGYDTAAIRVEDYDLWLRMIKKEMIIRTLPTALYTVRWDIDDYKRRNAKAKWREFRFRFNRFRDLGFGLMGVLFSLKPLLLLLIPSSLQFLKHKRSFKAASASATELRS